MSWVERMVPGSFRGVQFHVRMSEHSTGRRTVVHQFPFKKKPYVEDTGPAVKSYQVEAYVIGLDYLDQKERLLREIETEGQGELVHPYFGTKQVTIVGEPRVRETLEDGGMAVFSLEFIETSDPVQPSAVANPASNVVASASAARTAVGEDFVARYVTDAIHKDSIAGVLRNAALEIDRQVSRVGMATQELAALKQRVVRVKNSLGSLVALPGNILSEFTDIFGGVNSSKALTKIYTFTPGDRPVATTPSREDEQTNFDLSTRLIQRLAIIRAAEITPVQTFDSFDSAVAARDEIADLLDEQAEASSDDSYPAILQLRSDLVNAVPGDEDLPRLIPYSQAGAVPSLVLAHRLYGSVDREIDLVSRNTIENPAFVFGDIEVLSD